MRERRDACDRFLAPLVEDRDALVATHDTRTALDDMLERLVVAERAIDRYFWIDAIVELLAPLDEQQQRALMLRAARRVHAAFRLSVRERCLLERLLLRRMWPLD